MTAPCSFRTWDSEFFGLRIAQVTVRRLTSDLAREVVAWTSAERIACVYFLADAADPATLRVAARHGFDLVDVRVTLDTPASDVPQPPGACCIRPANADDVPSLERIARVSHRDSRFYQDGRFDRARCDDLFAAWILESCRGYADAVLAAERNGEAVGYITAHLEPEGRGRIGLTGVAPDVRDRGVGRTLVAGILDWFRGHGINRVSVATQGRNTRAIRLYERSGFVVSDIALWYHRWTEQPAHD